MNYRIPSRNICDRLSAYESPTTSHYAFESLGKTQSTTEDEDHLVATPQTWIHMFLQPQYEPRLLFYVRQTPAGGNLSDSIYAARLWFEPVSIM
jgi:hypothetical protein